MTIPIDLISNSRPPRFRWRQTVTSPAGDRVITHEGTLPAAVEDAVAALIIIARRQAKRLEGALCQIAEMSKTTPAEPVLPPVSLSKKSRGTS